MRSSHSKSAARVPAIPLTAALLTALGVGCGAAAEGPMDEAPAGLSQTEQALGSGQLPNNVPFLNPAGTAATFSSAGFVDLNNPFHVPQGTNGRSCESCHLPQTGWSVVPAEVELRFWLTGGKDPIFNLLDADSPTADVSNAKARHEAYSMLRKGLFRRGGNVPAN